MSTKLRSRDLGPSIAVQAERAGLTKGDVPGHEFHGNQWTGGGAGHDSGNGVPRSDIEHHRFESDAVTHTLEGVKLPKGWHVITATQAFENSQKQMRQTCDSMFPGDKEKADLAFTTLTAGMSAPEKDDGATRILGPSGEMITRMEGCKVPDARVADLTYQYESLIKSNPGGSQRVTIVSDADAAKQFGQDWRRVGGRYQAGLISLPEHALTDRWDYKLADNVRSGWSTAAAKEKSMQAYGLAHEYGHSLDPNGPGKAGMSEDLQTVFDSMKPTSRYGSTIPQEKYAEAFAEFVLSNGKSTFPGLQELAAKEGWKVP
jgi:hypothetical protein